MSPGAQIEYLDSIYVCYKRASRKQKSKILNEFCINTGYHKKLALRLLNQYKRFTKTKLKNAVNHHPTTKNRLLPLLREYG